MAEERKKYHLINELPRVNEIEQMIQFCKKYEQIYIHEFSKEDMYFVKYLKMCDIPVKGFVVDSKSNKEYSFDESLLNMVTHQDIKNEKNIGVLYTSKHDRVHRVFSKLNLNKIGNKFYVSNYNKRTIKEQVKPRPQTEMTFEISLCDHCNMACQMCDHFSQLSDKWYVDMVQFENDMKRMGELFSHSIAAISLLGGEPTLHPNIIDCLRITREQFPKAEIIILTNGTMLNKPESENLWKACRDYDIHITVTVYPIRLDYLAIENKAKEYNVALAMSSNIHAKQLTKIKKISDKHTMDLSKSIDKSVCVNCLYFNKFNVLKDGRLYMCPIAAHSNIFNCYFDKNLEILEEDYLDIYKISSWEEIAEFSCSYIPFCSYCDLKNWGPHSEWKSSSKKIDEYI